MSTNTQLDSDAHASLMHEQESSARRKRVLLGDNNPVIIESVRELLEPHFTIVGAVTDGEAVLREAVVLNPDVVILDISMGEPNGIAVAKQLQQACAHVKIVFLTVHEITEFIRIALASGGAAYVFKSLMRTDLIPAIDAACSGRVFVSCRNSEKGPR